MNRQQAQKKKRILHYGNDGIGYNLPHIHHSRHWTLTDTVLHLAIVLVPFPHSVPPQWLKQTLILSLFGMTMFTSYYSIRSQKRHTQPSAYKGCLNVHEAHSGMKNSTAQMTGRQEVIGHLCVLPAFSIKNKL